MVGGKYNLAMHEGATGPPTRGERQQQTRTALIDAARLVFIRDGYHGAGLGEIARVAGYSKGAVYSNFSGKADLFLEVMDDNIGTLGSETSDPFTPTTTETDPELVDMIRGMALASLEFIAVAARDDQLSSALAQRIKLMTDQYAHVAEKARTPDDALTATEVGTLLAALDQGITVLAVSGLMDIDQRVLRMGLRRLVDPARAATTEVSDDEGGDGPLNEYVERWVGALRDQMVRRVDDMIRNKLG